MRVPALASVKWPKLESIDVGESWLSKTGLASLKTIAKTIEGAKHQANDGGDPENRYTSGRE